MERLRGYLMRKPAWGPASLQRMIAARVRADTAALAARFRVREEWESEAAAQRERWAAHLEALGNPPSPAMALRRNKPPRTGRRINASINAGATMRTPAIAKHAKPVHGRGIGGRPACP